MFVILGLALFPLGLVAVLASVDAARDGRAERERSARVQAMQAISALDNLVTTDVFALRIIAANIVGVRNDAEACALFRRTIEAGPDLVFSRYALYGSDRRRLCGNDASPESRQGPTSSGTRISLDGSRRALRVEVAANGAVAAGLVDQATLRSALNASVRNGGMDVRLEQADISLPLVDGYDRATLRRMVVGRTQLAGSSVFAVASVGAIPMSAAEIASILLPLLMWLTAAALGWLIVDRLLLRPIVEIQRAVLAYRPGNAAIVIPAVRTPATEIRDLGEAFTRVTGTIAIHEADLEAAIARQGRLVREVHHRVKNNLQVVASLLNLHARGARSLDAANAYATIQRRVDALAVVHRNHFAELEDNRGVALRTLLSELTANLRATAPKEAAGMAIMLDLDTVNVNQDVAVSVAFFVTEIVEHAMLCTPADPVGVSLRQLDTPTIARLSLSSASLKADADCGDLDVRQFERITTGLSRQLRAPLDRDTTNGVFSIDIAAHAASPDD